MNLKSLMTRISLGVALAGALAVTLPASSYAFDGQRYFYSNPSEDPGSVWDFYPGYFNGDSLGGYGVHEDTRARAQATPRNQPRGNAGAQAAPQERVQQCQVQWNGGCR